jgi:hypothetical protein
MSLDECLEGAHTVVGTDTGSDVIRPSDGEVGVESFGGVHRFAVSECSG